MIQVDNAHMYTWGGDDPAYLDHARPSFNIQYLAAQDYYLSIFSLGFVYCGHRLWQFLRKSVIDRQTVLNDLALLGRARPNKKLSGTAVIAGGSIAGLLAARVCADHFESVLIVEPETDLGKYNYAHFTEDTGPNSELPKRARVSQYNAAHGYQVLTLRALKKLFPDFEDTARAWGARMLPADLRVHISGRLIAPPKQLTDSNGTLFASRHLFESVLRALVIRICGNVRFVHGSVVGLTSSPDPTRDAFLSGVIIRTNEKDSMQEASLLVDCTGVAQAGLKWLENAGYDRCCDLRVTYDPRFRGTTSHFRVPEDVLDNVGAVYLYIPDPRRDIRNFYIQRVERDWLQIVCAGYGISDRISSFEDITAFFSRATPAVLLPPSICDLPTTLFESGARPQGWQYFRLSNVSFVRYDTANAGTLPANFVAIGDAMCRMNPIHGQGVTLSVVGVVTLNAALVTAQKVLPPDFASKFFTSVTARTIGTWEANKCNDYGFPTTERTPGDGPRYGAFQRWYSAHLAEVASYDAGVAATLWEVLNFLAPGTDMLSPSIMLKVLWNSFKSFAGK